MGSAPVSALPEGFTLDQPQAAPDASQLPAGFQLDAKQEPSGVMDFFKSIPRGLVGGLMDAATALGKSTSIEMGQPEMVESMPTREQAVDAIEKNVTGEMHKPETSAGKFGERIGEFAGNPASYIGPGSLARKVVTTGLAAIGNEGAGQLAEGTKYEVPARVVGTIAGGATGGLKQPNAKIPTVAELDDAATALYSAAKNSGLELNPSGLSGRVTQLKQALNADYVDNALAPKTFSVLDKLENPPQGATITGGNLESARKVLGKLAAKGDEEGLAATRAIKTLDDYVGGIPKGDVIAGDADVFANAIKDARGNYAAARRADMMEGKFENADLRTATTNSGGNLANNTRQAAASILRSDKLSRGFTPDELKEIEAIARGTFVGNMSRKVANLLGAGGGFGQVVAATLGGGAGMALGGHIGAEVGAAGTVGAAKIARAIHENSVLAQAEKASQRVRSRSPLFDQMNPGGVPARTGMTSVARTTGVTGSQFNQNGIDRLLKGDPTYVQSLPDDQKQALATQVLTNPSLNKAQIASAFRAFKLANSADAWNFGVKNLIETAFQPAKS